MTGLILYLEVSSPPPPKNLWHDTSKSSRGEWSENYEIITNWFCSSHGFRKQHGCIIDFGDICIEMNGSELRYLAPNMRSIASLIWKAYNVGLSLAPNKRKESTPGILVSKGIEINSPLIKYYCVYEQVEPSDIPIEGMIVKNISENAIPIKVPASNMSQSLIWLNYYK